MAAPAGRPLTPERWQQVREIFYSALELEVEDRAAFLDSTCAGQGTLRGEIDALLAQHDASGGLLDSPAWEDTGPEGEEPEAVSRVGQRIGPYEVREDDRARRHGRGVPPPMSTRSACCFTSC